MAIPRLLRSRYYDPATSFEFPHESDDHFNDFEEFHLPLARVHQALHDWGVAQGLEVAGAPGDIDLVVSAGVAINADGQLICLATGGHGEVGSNPAGGAATSDARPTPVHLPVAGWTNHTLYVTIQHYERLVHNQGAGGKQEQVPWLRLREAGGASPYVNDGQSIILAVVRVTNGAVTWLRPSDPSMALGRKLVGQSLSELRVMRPHQAGILVDDTVSGTIGPRTGGGLVIAGASQAGASGNIDLRVPTGSDDITLARANDQNFASLVARANSVVVKDNVGNDALTFQSGSSALTIGVQGNDGDLTIRDNAGNQALRFTASNAVLRLGTIENAGDLHVLNNSAGTGVRIDGQAGTVFTQRLARPSGVIDVDASFLRIHGVDLCLDGRSQNNNRALVDWYNTLILNYDNDYGNGVETDGALRVAGELRAGGRLIKGNPARYVSTRWMHVDNGTVTEEVVFSSSRQVFAFVAMTGCDPRAGFDSGDEFAFDIFKVDGNKTFAWLNGGQHNGPAGSDANVFAQTYEGPAERVLFRARSFQDATVWGIGVVFYE